MFFKDSRMFSDPSSVVNGIRLLIGGSISGKMTAWTKSLINGDLITSRAPSSLIIWINENKISKTTRFFQCKPFLGKSHVEKKITGVVQFPEFRSSLSSTPLNQNLDCWILLGEVEVPYSLIAVIIDFLTGIPLIAVTKTDSISTHYSNDDSQDQRD